MISLCMVIRNEAVNIASCLHDIKDAVDEIVIVDQSSDDQTLEIVGQYTDKIFIRPDAGFCEPDRQHSINQAKFPWVLILDADERLDQTIKNNLQKIVDGKYDAYWINRKDIIDGHLYETGIEDLQLRLFKKRVVAWPRRMHAYPKLYTDNIGKINGGYILHARTFERIKQIHEQRNRFVQRELKAKHEQFVKEVQDWLLMKKTQQNAPHL